MARRNNSRSNRGPANDKIDSVSEDLNPQENTNQDNQNPENVPTPSTEDSDPRGDSNQDEKEQAGEPNAGDDKADLSVDQPAPPAIDSPDDVDDQSGVEDAPGPVSSDDDEDDEEEPEAPRPQRGAPQSEEGMGFPRKNGRTLSIFSNKPHEVVRNVAGVMTPMTREEAVGDSTKGVEPKTDAEAIEKLKKMGKL